MSLHYATVGEASLQTVPGKTSVLHYVLSTMKGIKILMKKDRFLGADVWRFAALVLVILYHSWVLLQSFDISNIAIRMIIMHGGEIGVTLFFILSGFGIYCSIDKKDLSYVEYLQKRFWRIAPSYYVAIIFTITLTDAATFVSFGGIKHIIAHVFFLHNFWIETHGSIIGVLWTMAVIVQFYLIAPLIKRVLDKYPYAVLLFGLLISITLKIILYHFIIPHFSSDSYLYFVYGRQVYTSLDNFIIGMFMAWLIKKSNEMKVTKIILVVLEVLLIVGVVIWCYVGNFFGVYADGFCGYTWHSILALLLGLLICLTELRKPGYDNPIGKFILWVSDNEYGIYIWHFIILNTSLTYSSIIIELNNRHMFLVIIVFWIVESTIIGTMYNFGINNSVEKIKRMVFNGKNKFNAR